MMSKYRMIERFVGAWLVLIGATLCFSGNLNHGLGLALIGLIAYLTNEELCANAVYNLFKRKAEEWRSSDEKH